MEYLEGEFLPVNCSMIQHISSCTFHHAYLGEEGAAISWCLGFYTATNAIDRGQCLLLTNSFPSHIPGQTTTLVEVFAHFKWCHNNNGDAIKLLESIQMEYTVPQQCVQAARTWWSASSDRGGK
jgi:hypothetical protein